MNEYPKSCQAVTKFIRTNTDDKLVELRRGKGYFYFTGGKADNFSEQGVYVTRISETSFQGWLNEYNDKVSKL